MNGFRKRLSLGSTLLVVCMMTAITVPALPAQTGNIHIRQANSADDGNDVGRTQIVVDGPSALGYDGVTNEALDIWVAVHIDKSTSTPNYRSLVLQAESSEIEGEVTAATRRYKFTIPYADPRSGSVTGQRNSAVAACNGRLASLNGPARTSFLRDGAEIKVTGAYRLKAVGSYTTTKKGEKKGAFEEAPTITQHTDEAVAMANAVIVCRALNRPRPRTSTSTTGATRGPGKALPPVIAAAELRIEPARVMQVGGQMCPTELKLYGRVEASRAFNGKAVIFGSGFLSPVTALSYSGPGNRNIVATYPLSWANRGGLAGAAPTGPRSQSVTLTMNVTNEDNKVQESVKETVTVTCKPARLSSGTTGGAVGGSAGDVAAEPATVDMEMWSWHEAARASEPAAARARSPGGPMTIEKRVDVGTPSARPAVDAHIRKVDRSGPGGATRLWLRNGGTQQAENCELAARRQSDQSWSLIGTFSLAPGETREIKAAMPRDPGLEFAVTCAGEAGALLANNIARLQ